jgi:phage gp45-like
MHRQTPLTAAFVGYNSGGARALVDTADDTTGMQEMKGSMLHGEARQRIESPQNYGFTSVVLPAKKDKDGRIEEAAEAYLSFLGGNRTFPVAAVMDDRRHRPWGLKPGENAQYDDLGQMTLMRRGGLYMMSLDGPDESQQSQSGGATPTQQAEQQQNVERMVSMRHVEKKKQPRPKGNGSKEGADHKHEGESVNTEVRCTKNRIEFRAGEKVVGFYDKAADTWHFLSKIIIHEATEQTWSKSPKNDHGMTEA